MKSRDVETLRDLARRVDANVPDHRNPDRFHQEKSDIVDALRGIVRRSAPPQQFKPRGRSE